MVRHWTGTETDTVSPQALRANVSPKMFQTKFLRQWFFLPLSQFDVPSERLLQLIVTTCKKTNSLSEKYKSKKEQWRKISKQNTLGAAFAARGNRALISLSSSPAVWLWQKHFSPNVPIVPL